MSQLDYKNAAATLKGAFAKAESLAREGRTPAFPTEVESHLKLIFSSGTQAYREVLIGCVLASLADESIDIRKPYASQGENSFNGRTLDEVVVNPFLHERRVPSSRGPYLSTFRRSVDFTPATRQGVRDKIGFDALLELIEYVQSLDRAGRDRFLVGLLYGFVQLRESSLIPLSKLNRASVAQYSRLIEGLLKVPSGGRLPVIIVISVLHAIEQHFSLRWNIEFQGINEADAAGGAGGDSP